MYVCMYVSLSHSLSLSIYIYIYVIRGEPLVWSSGLSGAPGGIYYVRNLLGWLRLGWLKIPFDRQGTGENMICGATQLDPTPSN